MRMTVARRAVDATARLVLRRALSERAPGPVIRRISARDLDQETKLKLW